ncbi:MAG: hypothetical protein KAQ94_02070 [Arcobacteraceae bacterium]|nr:hypothetical protein [Arcobacteraceae bacterium]
MNPKKWLISFFLLTVFLILSVISFNYSIDPYGYQSRNNKYMKNLSEVSKTTILHNRIISDGYYYLIGTSRMVRVDPSYVEKTSTKKTHNIHIDGSTLKENYLLAKYVKNKDKNFLYGFDAFSFNKSRLEYAEIKNRYNTYKKELSSSPNLFTQYFNAELLSASIKHKKYIRKNKDFYENFKTENKYNYQYSLESVNNDKGYDNKQLKKNFTNYKGYSEEEVIKLAKLATKNDKFIIFPKHYYNYILFNKYQNINKQYLNAIRILVNNTKAEVWSFYQINDITMNSDNFDGYGWHFKPKIANMIFKRIFTLNKSNKQNDFGILLTSKNIDTYLNTLTHQIQGLNIE